MDMSAFTDTLLSALGDKLPAIVGAVAILVLGWLVAIVVRAMVRRGGRYVGLNDRIRSVAGTPIDVEYGLASGAYYLVLLLALIGFLNVLNLGLVSGPLQSLVDQVLAYVPRVAAAGVLVLVAWLLASLLRRLATRGLAATTLDEKLSAQAGMRPISETLGNVLYWLVILLFLPAVLGALGLNGLLQPVQGMIDDILAMIPNVVGATIIGLIGWFVARLLRDLVSNLLGASGIDALGQRIGLREGMPLSRLLGVVVYVLTLVPALIAALDALQIEAISAPATDMLGTFLDALPHVFAAVLIVGLAYFVSRIVAGMATEMLAGVGFDELPGRIGLGNRGGGARLSVLAGRAIIFFAVLFASVEAANRLGFGQISQLVAAFLEFGGQVLLGVVIIGVGLWISRIAAEAIRRVESRNAVLFAGLARTTILGLVLAMGLRAMGIADDIVNLAFGLTLGSVAVAVALSFGLGGREAAGRQMDHWFARLRGDE